MHHLGLKARDVTLRVGDAELLSGANLDIEPGSLNLISGKSGSGKSTLMKALVLLYPLAAGRITLDGEEIDDKGAQRLRSRVRFISQSPRFHQGTVELNLRIPFTYASNLSRKYSREKALETLAGLDLDAEKIISSPAAEVSGGEALRVSLARALLLKPDFLLLDEPFSALDDETAHIVSRVVLRESRAGKGIALASHQLPAGLEDGVERYRLVSGRLERL